MTNEYVYLLREREFIRLKEHVYKIGMTKQEPKNRFSAYPKQSEILMLVNVSNSHVIEQNIKKNFKEKFIQRTDIGDEYFEGSKEKIFNEFFTIIYKHDLEQCNNININNEQTHKENEDNDKKIIIKSDECVINKKYCCKLCNYHTDDRKYWYAHKKSVKYTKKINNGKSDHKEKKNSKKIIIKSDECFINKKYCCKLCNYCTNDRKYWYAHKKSKKHINMSAIVNTTHNDTYLCSYCTYSTNRKNNLTRHLNTCLNKLLKSKLR